MYRPINIIQTEKGIKKRIVKKMYINTESNSLGKPV